MTESRLLFIFFLQFQTYINIQEAESLNNKVSFQMIQINS